MFQGGAGTSTNMNANEVIANRALELMGHKKGEYKHCEPARPRQRLAVHERRLPDRRCTSGWPSGTSSSWPPCSELIAAFRAKGKEFATILKMGRTQLQDAVPMTLGQEFEAFAETLAGEVRALEAIQRVLCETNMGATAIGTGLNAPAGYAREVHRRTSRRSPACRSTSPRT